MKPKLTQRKGNVYHTPVETPESETPRQWREVKTPFMEQHSQENVDLWWSIFREVGEECPDRTRRQRRCGTHAKKSDTTRCARGTQKDAAC